MVAHAPTCDGAARCAPQRWLAYTPRYGLANRLLELQAALRIAHLTNRTLILPELFPGMKLDAFFRTCPLRRQYCIIDEDRVRLPKRLASIPAVTVHGETQSIYMRRPVSLVRYPVKLWYRDGQVSTLDVGQYVASNYTSHPIVLLLSTLRLLREPAAACSDPNVQIHCDRPGVNFWVPPAPHVVKFWRLLALRPTLASRVNELQHGSTSKGTNNGNGAVGVHMRYADGSCEDRVAIWWGGMKLHPPRPKCGKIPGCTNLDRACCDFKLIPSKAPNANRFPPSLSAKIQSFCEPHLARGGKIVALAKKHGFRKVYLAADGQRPDLEEQLERALRKAGLTVQHRPRASDKVWASSFEFAGWNSTDVADSLVDMFTLADTDLFIANPASSFSGCVRDIRAAHRYPLASTQVGLPPHHSNSQK